MSSTTIGRLLRYTGKWWPPQGYPTFSSTSGTPGRFSRRCCNMGKRNSLAKGMAMYTFLHINANRFPNIYGLGSLQEGYSNVETIMGHNCPTPKFRVYSRALCVVGLLSIGYCSSLWMTCRSPELWPGPISASHCCPLYAPFTLHLQHTTTVSHKISAHWEWRDIAFDDRRTKWHLYHPNWDDY